MTRAEIFLVDDEAPAREMVGDYLKMHGFGVTLATAAKPAPRDRDHVPDLVVLDLNIPRKMGSRSSRPEEPHQRSRNYADGDPSPIDRVVGLELGADDYMAKPCELRELMAVSARLLRRSTPQGGLPRRGPRRQRQGKAQLVRFGTKWLDLEAQALRDDEGNEHPLTASESAC